MKRLRDPNWVLIFAFVAIIAGVPLAQTILEARQDEGVVALEVFNDRPTAANLRAYEKKLETTSWAGKLSRPWIQFAQFKWLKYGGEKAVVAGNGWYFFKPGLNYMLERPDLARAATATNDPLPAIVNFRDQLAARGIHLLLMPVPNKDTIYPDRLTRRASGRGTIVAPRTRELLNRLHTAGVEVVNLFDEFSKGRDLDTNAKSLYLAQDTHWSPVGVDLAAKAVARRLNELEWVQPGKTDYVERPTPVQRLGDILHMLQAPPVEQSVTPETAATVQVVRSDNNQLYKDDPGSKVLVLGDSFMRVFEEDVPTQAGFIAHLAKELKQPLLSLVNDGGGATIVREELCGRSYFLKDKKVVIWEFVERDIGLGTKGWKLTQIPNLSAQ